MPHASGMHACVLMKMVFKAPIFKSFSGRISKETPPKRWVQGATIRTYTSNPQSIRSRFVVTTMTMPQSGFMKSCVWDTSIEKGLFSNHCCWLRSFASTHPICLSHIHIAVGVIIHPLVDTTDGFEGEIGILILAQEHIDAAEVWQRKRVMWRWCKCTTVKVGRTKL